MQLVDQFGLLELLLSCPFAGVDLASMGPSVEGLASMVPFEVELASMEEVSPASFVAVSDLDVCGLDRVRPYHGLHHVGDRDDLQLLASDGQRESVLVHVLPCRDLDREDGHDGLQFLEPNGPYENVLVHGLPYHDLHHVGDRDDLLEEQILFAH